MNNNEKLCSIGKMLYGKNWKRALAHDLKISERTMGRFASNQIAVKDSILQDAENVAKQRITELKDVLK